MGSRKFKSCYKVWGTYMLFSLTFGLKGPL